MTSKLLYESRDYLAFYKPSGLPTVPLKGQSCSTLLGEAAISFPEVLSVTGANPWEGSAMHRLDTLTSGIVIFARNQDSYDYLQKAQQNGLFWKFYEVRTAYPAECLEGFPQYCFSDPASENAVISSYFRSYGRRGSSVRPVTDSSRFHSGRVYSTEVHAIGQDRFLCMLNRGFRHQIRCHMAWSGHPVSGDEQYGAPASPEPFGLEAVGVSFPGKDGHEVSFGTTFQHRIQ